jgi:hypothetical protein
MELLTQNYKIKKSSTDEWDIWNFGITAVKTCPNADACLKGCYALQGAYMFGNVKPVFEKRYEVTLSEEFIPSMVEAVEDKLQRALKKGKKLIVRIHDSGDFYSRRYFLEWCAIAGLFPEVKFYAYTKMVSMIQSLKSELPDNFRVIFSEGGTEDKIINPNIHRHAKVFSTKEELRKAGYINGTDDDKIAALSDNKKIGLIYHGASSKKWETK